MKRTWIADISLLLVALIWGSTFIIVQAAVQTLPPLAFNAIRFLGAAALFFVVMACSPKVWFALLVSIGLSTGFGFWAQTWSQQYTSPARVAIIFAMEPVFAAITGVAFANEKLGQLALWGSMCIFLSMIIAEWKWRPREVH